MICDRKRLISPHAFYLGVSGSGKSVAMKNTIANVALSTNDDIIIIDAEREYAPIARALGGEVIEISRTASTISIRSIYKTGTRTAKIPLR